MTFSTERGLFRAAKKFELTWKKSMQHQRQPFNQQLQQWVSVYARETGAAETDAFKKVLSIARDMESQKILKPVIYYQFMMTFQALSCIAGVKFTDVKIKKILAILYPDDSYVSDLTQQTMQLINDSVTAANANPANAAVIEQLRQNPIAINPQPPQPQFYNGNVPNTMPGGPPPGPIS